MEWSQLQVSISASVIEEVINEKFIQLGYQTPSVIIARNP